MISKLRNLNKDLHSLGKKASSSCSRLRRFVSNKKFILVLVVLFTVSAIIVFAFTGTQFAPNPETKPSAEPPTTPALSPTFIVSASPQFTQGPTSKPTQTPLPTQQAIMPTPTPQMTTNPTPEPTNSQIIVVTASPATSTDTPTPVKLHLGIYKNNDTAGSPQPLTEINWFEQGPLSPGQSRNSSIIYFRNEGNVPITISFLPSGWSLQDADGKELSQIYAHYYSLTWDYDGSTISVNETRPIVITLTVSPDTETVATFSFDITIAVAY